MIEKELKYQLNESDFYNLKRYFFTEYKKITEHEQTNYYLDTKNFCLKKQGLSVRIRYLNGIYEFTLKSKVNNYDLKNIKIKNETTIILDEEIAKNIIINKNLTNCPKIFELISNIYYGNLLNEDIFLLGELKTLRTTFSLKASEEICLDKSYFCDKKDYEIEWETSDLINSNMKLQNIFKQLNISPLNNDDSKSTRFIKRLCDIDSSFKQS